MLARSRVLISGLVQGVFFRREISYLARQLGVTGWTRNLSDGSVEVIAEGDKEAIDKLIQFCRVGPSGARVRNVSVKWEDFKGEFRGFRITR
ncbi:MAG: acylphosphatase [Crenarchaeota archaeon 13_1_40CM_2_52_14]|nr:MAG: acylphosphatase [Crenarchaeota archaeon 13_1_40CM_3_52_17]OLD35887.1 MAG: acylphosphatase [Crenarchaeota archaeon 13_1_40CM_2_52_14]